MHRCLPALALAIGALMGCGSDSSAVNAPDDSGSDPGPEGATPQTDAPPGTATKLVIVPQSSPVVTNECSPFTLGHQDASNTPLAFPRADVTVTSDDPTTKIFPTREACAENASSATFPGSAGATATPFFVRTAAEGAVTLTATAPFAATGTFTFTPSQLSVVGQPDTQTIRQFIAGISQPAGVFYAGGKFLLAETGSARVFVWNSFPATASEPPSLVLGQPNASTIAASTASASTFAAPLGMWTDGVRLAIVDRGNHRVLVWSTFPTINQQPATFALGQPAGAANLTSGVANNGGRSGATLSSPEGVYSDGTRLVVADAANHRVLVWNTFPTSGGQSADFAIGQPAGADNLTSGASAASASGLASPTGVAGDGTRLFVADSGHHRVLVWSALPTSGGTDASFALGQPAGANNLLTFTSNNGGRSATSMTRPTRVATDGTRVAVSDAGNHRVLVWSALPTTGGQAADFALGQPGGANNLTSGGANNGGLSGSSLATVEELALAAGKLAIVDRNNNRVLAWSTLPTSAFDAASFAIGQPPGPSNLITNRAHSIDVDGTSFQAVGVATDGTRLFVSDMRNHRVLVWNKMPSGPLEPASFALGQPAGADNLRASESNNGGVSGTSMNGPWGVFVNGGRLFVADRGNDRILVWNTIPTDASTSASFALGQPSLSSNVGAVTASSLRGPTEVYTDGTRLFVGDSSNHRVLVWNTIPAASGAPADFALGQPAGPNNLTSNSVFGVTSASTLVSPTAIRVIGGRLFVNDFGGNRVLGWNTIPTTGGAPADFALGQPAGAANLTSGVQNNGGVSASSMNAPYSLASDGTRLFVSDAANSRVLVWDTIPTNGGAPATSVIGQPSFTTNLANAGGPVSKSSLLVPLGLHASPTRLIIVDSNNFRVLLSPL